MFVWFYNLTVSKRFQEPECLIEFITKQNQDVINELILSNLAEQNVYRLIDNLPMNLKRIKIISGKKDIYTSYCGKWTECIIYYIEESCLHMVSTSSSVRFL